MILPLLVVQLSVSARVPDRLVKNLLLALMTPPVAILAYSTFVRLAEPRPAVEVEPRGALKEHGLVAFVGALFLRIVVAILAIAGAFSIAETSTAAAMLIPLTTLAGGAVVLVALGPVQTRRS